MSCRVHNDLVWFMTRSKDTLTIDVHSVRAECFLMYPFSQPLTALEGAIAKLPMAGPPNKHVFCQRTLFSLLQPALIPKSRAASSTRTSKTSTSASSFPFPAHYRIIVIGAASAANKSLNVKV